MDIYKLRKDGQNFEQSNEKVSIDDLDNYGFHFTLSKNNKSILATGLRPQIGTNSKGNLGREANPKTFFTKGLDGTMQMFNRMINLSNEIPIDSLLLAPDKAEFLMDHQKQYGEGNLTMLESFEYMRRYAEHLNYFVFPVKEPEYAEGINEDKLPEQLETINKIVKMVSIAIPSNVIEPKNVDVLLNQAYALRDSYSQELKENPDNNDVQNKLEKIKSSLGFLLQFDSTQSLEVGDQPNLIRINDVEKTFQGIDFLSSKLLTSNPELIAAKEDFDLARAGLSNQVREATVGIVDGLIRGKVDLESLKEANYERIDFNEDRLCWVDQMEKPYNCHTLLKTQGRGIGVNESIESAKIGANDLSLLSNRPDKAVNAIKLIRTLFSKSYKKDPSCIERFRMNYPKVQVDTNLIYEFLQYCQLYDKTIDVNPEEFRKKALIIEKKAVDKKISEKVERKAEKVGTMTEEEKTQYLERQQRKVRCTNGRKLDALMNGIIKDRRISKKKVQVRSQEDDIEK